MRILDNGLPRTAASGYTVGTPVAMSDLKPGDLLFYVTAMPNPATGQYDEKYPYANPTQEDIQKVLSTMGITVQAGVSRVEVAVSMAGENRTESQMLPISEVPETVPDTEWMSERGKSSEFSEEPMTESWTESSTETEPATELPAPPETESQTESATESQSEPQSESQSETITESESETRAKQRHSLRVRRKAAKR